MNPKVLVLTLAASTLISCGNKEKEAEEEALIEKYDEQKEALADLESTIKRLESKVKENEMPDPSEEIQQLTEQLEDMENQRETLKTEIADLKTTKKAAEDKLSAYKGTYPLRSK